MTPAATQDFYSIGHLAGMLQRSTRAIERLANKLKITPAMRVNGVAHFDGSQVERIAGAFRAEKPTTK